MITLLDKRKDGEENNDEGGEFESLVLYREKLVKEFHYRGFVKFKNLAKISRPGKRKRKEKKEDEERKRNERKEFCVVEEEMKGLLGEEFKGDVFSGVGLIAISAAKIVKRVYANDLNPFAVEYLERNSVLNKLERKIKVFIIDGRRFINAMFSSEKVHSITHVVMNLPNDAAEFLDAFRGVYRGQPRDKEFNFPMIHVYGFSKARDPEFDFHERIRIALQEVAVNVEMCRVRLVPPGKYMLCASFILPESVAFAEMKQLLLQLSVIEMLGDAPQLDKTIDIAHYACLDKDYRICFGIKTQPRTNPKLKVPINRAKLLTCSIIIF
ncbi:hypothetical protein DITRI_Ditri01bG0161700 [Diplodiscus trichospermus]